MVKFSMTVRHWVFAFLVRPPISWLTGKTMHKIFALVFMALMATPLAAQDSVEGDAAGVPPIIFPADQVDLNEFLWIKRPLIVFADAPADPQFLQQMDFITNRLDALDARDVVVITDTDPSANGDLRQQLRPRGFMLVLMGKDGTIYLRKPFPWNVREISRSIDKLPTRQREMREEQQGDS